MDFGALPPEFNSARMYAGPGLGPMVAAATAWEGLAAELSSAASSYGSVVSGLTGGPWLGPASLSMAAAAAPYVGWMNATAAQAAQTATQAKAAATAYETAFAMTVPPPVIAANRAQLMVLVAMNFFGQNTPAITATEAQYGEMWAQDAAAMYGYAASSATATRVTPFTAAPQTTSLAGLAGQAAAVAQAASTQVTSAIPQALESLASPAASTSFTSGLSAQFVDLLQALTGSSTLSLASPLGAFTTLSGPISDAESMFTGLSGLVSDAESTFTGLFSFGQGLVKDAPEAAKAAAGLPGILLNIPGLAGLGGPAGLGGLDGGTAAGLGHAGSIGALSVPPSWAAPAAAASSELPAALPGSTVGGASGAIPAPNAIAGMPLASGRMGMGGFGRGMVGDAPRYGFRLTVVAHSPAAG
ncbi:PPE family protein [Mycobacterium sp.]|uniref:PPE family protein n=1 Tax=Mycobacterium sp. TaxID=1785 RepID=UPI003F972569